MGGKSKWITTTTVICLLFLPVSSAFAHAQITATSPKRGVELTELPEEVMVEFDGNLTVIEDLSINILKVFNQSGVQIDNGKTLVGGARLTVGIENRTGTGIFRVVYRVVSEDGHPVEGEFKFSVAASPTNSPTKSPTKSPTTKSTVDPSSDSSQPTVKEVFATSNHVAHHQNFIFHHRVHLIEFTVVALLIFIWWLVERRRIK